MLLKKLAHQRRPDRHRVRRIDHKMAVTSEWRQHAILRISSRRYESVMHPLCQLRPKIAVILRVYPQHRHSRSPTEFASSGDELVGSTIVVGFAVYSTPASRSEGDDGLN